MAAVDPEIAVISAGADNPFGHPSSEVVGRLVDRLGEDKVYRTDEDGTIEFITDGEVRRSYIDLISSRMNLV